MQPTTDRVRRHESALAHRKGSSRLLAVLACGMLAALGATARADDTAGKQGATQERLFLQSASNGGLAEVELGKLAEQRASNAEVKSFGARMVKDHSKANEDLAALAARKGVSFPTQMDRKDEERRDRLAALSGAAFDKAYMQDMTEDHEHDVAAFREAAKNSSDPDVRDFAAQTLPTLTEHLDQSKRIQAALGASANANPNRQAPHAASRY
jgi:putative membrane protein